MLQGDEFNSEIIQTTEVITAKWLNEGYDINSYFTHDLPYGPDCCVKANHPPHTMCVAAVTEVILTALTSWHQRTGDGQPFQKLPMKSWQGGTKKDIRGHIFMYDGFGCNGTAHALSRFGIRRMVPSRNWSCGFINLNRADSGDACVFLALSTRKGMTFQPLGRRSPDSATSPPSAAIRANLVIGGRFSKAYVLYCRAKCALRRDTQRKAQFSVAGT